MADAPALTVYPLEGIGEISKGDDLTAIIGDAYERIGGPEPGDVLVVTHKVVSKAEGAVREVPEGTSHRAIIEDEASQIIRRRCDLVITRTHHGFICANAGVDQSNASPNTVVLLPRDPDASAHRILTKLEIRFGIHIPVIISDTFGRAWRRGLTDVAIGLSGMQAIEDLRGTTDSFGMVLEVTEIAVVDELAAAADLVMGKATGIPAAVIRGYTYPEGSARATDLIRPDDEDMFR